MNSQQFYAKINFHMLLQFSYILIISALCVNYVHSLRITEHSVFSMSAKKKVFSSHKIFNFNDNFNLILYFKIVVTGVGAVTPVGIGADVSYKAMCEGKSGIVRLPAWADEFPSKASISILQTSDVY